MMSGAARRGPNKPAILAIILVSYVMIVLDISVVLTGLPKIRQDLGFSDASLAWVQTAYTLTFGGLLLLGARAGDMLGRRLMLMVGLAIFTVASVAIGASQSAIWMLGWRAVQGLGSAILAPSTLALLQITFPEGPERTRAVSYYSAAAGASATFGLVLGGVLADWLSWRVGFLINLPIGVGLILAARAFVTEGARRPGHFDLPGALTSTIGMTALAYGFLHAARSGWSDPGSVIAILAAVLCLVAFVFIERRQSQPILPLRLFASPGRSGAYIARTLYLGGMVGFFFFTTIYLQDVAAYGPALTGLAFLPATLLHVPFSVAVPRLTRWFSLNQLLVAGMLIGIVGMAWLSRVSPQSGYLLGVAAPMLLIGISQGLTLSPLTSAGVAGVSPEDAGAASGAVNVAHQLGTSVGLSLLVAISSLGATGLAGPALTAHRVVLAFDAASVMLVVAFLVAIVTIVLPHRRHACTVCTVRTASEDTSPARR
ncbi:MFS transporter [Azorhizobium oxalatiphilum]|uniref:MFS transporter n=1 Tax=Azorhizobium oxalatiphilum TaxID=980631 RepID=A0A917BXK9_9HYPH|nr:MFS transporter [Azorhizobium oxalatiphilum]GGF62419.1 MFS transporter [Azorhizobium oxalatiphilum]